MSHGQKQVFAIFQMQEERAWLEEPCTRSHLAGIMARVPAAADALHKKPRPHKGARPGGSLWPPPSQHLFFFQLLQPGTHVGQQVLIKSAV